MTRVRREGYRLDLHVHSQHSRDGRGTVLDLARQVKAKGLQGFALTDHDTVAGHEHIAQAARETGLLIVPGVEVTTRQGHILALGVHVPPPPRLDLADACKAIESLGGLAVAAHPLRLATGVGPSRLREASRAGHLDACEALNAREGELAQRNTARLVDELGLAATGGSDAHEVRHAGTAWTWFEQPCDDVADVLDAIRQGRTRGEGWSLPRRDLWAQRARMMGDAIGRAWK